MLNKILVENRPFKSSAFIISNVLSGYYSFWMQWWLNDMKCGNAKQVPKRQRGTCCCNNDREWNAGSSIHGYYHTHTHKYKYPSPKTNTKPQIWLPSVRSDVSCALFLFLSLPRPLPDAHLWDLIGSFQFTTELTAQSNYRHRQSPAHILRSAWFFRQPHLRGTCHL